VAPSRGQSTVEYALLLATITISILLGGAAFGPAVAAWLHALVAYIVAT